MADSNVDGTKNRKIAITNNDQGPRYVFTARGQEVIRPGDTLTTEASEAQIQAIEATHISDTDEVEMFTVESTDDDLDTGSDQGNALEGLPLAKLRSIAAAEGVPLTGRKDLGGGNDLPDLKKAADIIEAIKANRAAHPDGAVA